MSFLSSNWFLALTAFVISYLSVSVSVKATASGWVYQTIEWLIVFSLAFVVMKLVARIPRVSS
ncbi:hypothetical protein [Alkalicoccobacillus gibsonii]|uniref:hypothetical protein n=1 Tax=Alkalicoccobacillus gibsonii TaxID=79881 RepID=UPI003515BC46